VSLALLLLADVRLGVCTLLKATVLALFYPNKVRAITAKQVFTKRLSLKFHREYDHAYQAQ